MSLTPATRSSTARELLSLLWLSRDNQAVSPVFAAALDLFAADDSPHSDAPAQGMGATRGRAALDMDAVDPNRLAGLGQYTIDSAAGQSSATRIGKAYRAPRGPALAPPCRRNEQSPSARESASKAEFAAIWGAGRKLSADPAEAKKIAHDRANEKERDAAKAAGLSIRAYRAERKVGV